MPQSFTSPTEYLASLPDDRKQAISAIRKVIRANLDKKFKEGIQYGMIGYFVPHSVYPDGYHCDPKQPLPFASLASQKNHMALYLFCIYTEPGEAERFAQEWKATGKKLDMGKSCIRFKKLEDVPLDVIGRTIKRITAKKFIAAYESSREGAGTASARRATKRTAKKATKKAAKKAGKRTVKKTAKKAPEKVAKKATKRTVKRASKKVTKRASQKKVGKRRTKR